MNTQYIDLGLPSGTLWAAENEPGHHQFDEAVKTFGEMLPTIDAWQELFEKCSHKWNDERKGYVLTGPNGNTLFLPATSCMSILNTHGGKNRTFHLATYWSSTPRSPHHALYAYFSQMWDLICCVEDILCKFSIRLCKPAGAQ